MPMIQIDLSNIWGEISLPDLLALEREISAAHMALGEGTGAGGEFRGWMELPARALSEEHRRIQAAAERVGKTCDACVVLGVGGGSLGARGIVELLQGPNRNLTREQGSPQLFFAGNSFSTRQWQELCRLLEGKDYAIIVISQSGETLETAVAFRKLRWLLERKYGTDECNRRIYAVTDPVSGPLRQMARENGWESFSISVNVKGAFTVLSPAGLLPMAVAGLDIGEILQGAAQAREELDLRSYENPVWQYAAVRNLMLRCGRETELFASFQPGFRAFGAWWQQLFGEAEGKDGKGLLPVAAEYTQDLYTLGQRVQEGKGNLFETLVHFADSELSVTIDGDVKDLDGLNYLEGRTLEDVQEAAFQAIQEAHADSGVPVIPIDCGPLNEQTVGQLIFFLELSCAVSAYTLGVNPFESGEGAIWQRNLLAALGKPDTAG